MDEKLRKPATAAKQKYNEANYDRLYPYIQKGKKAIYQAAADRIGISLNEFVERACDKYAATEGEG